MLSLIGRSYYPHLLGYVFTFCSFGVLGGVVSRDPDYIIMAGIFLIGWAAGPALFVFHQRAASERFLRTLPVTHGEIVIARFLAVLILLGICSVVLLYLILTVPRTAEETEICSKFACAAVAWSLVAGGLAQLWLAHRGPSVFLGVLLNVLLVMTTIPFLAANKQPGRALDTADSFFVSVVTSPPWAIQAFLPLVGLWVYLTLMKVAATTSRPL
jgi:hypothetical protein